MRPFLAKRVSVVSYMVFLVNGKLLYVVSQMQTFTIFAAARDMFRGLNAFFALHFVEDVLK